MGSEGGRVHSTPTAQSLRVLPKGKEGELALHEALNRKVHGGYGLSDNEDDFSDSSSVCSDRSATFAPRNGGKRATHGSNNEDVSDILNLCQSSLWNERKEGLTGLHSLIQKRTNFSRLDIKRIIDIFTRMFADPHGKVFSMFLEMLPDFISIYKDQLDDWLYIVMTQLLKKMGADLLGSVQTKVLKALQVVRESFPTQLQFTILSRYIVDQTQRPSLKVKIALLQYLLELTALMQPSEITNSSDTRLGISRIITWTTEPKSPDIRKYAEQLLIAIFEKNAGQFTMMIRILPKTFQDGAMKVLQGYMQTNGDSNSFNPPAAADNGGHVVSRVAVSPTRVIVASPNNTTGSVDAISPRSNNVHNHHNKSESNMNKEEIEENFRDITAGIHKLRMDSNAELSPLLKDDILARGDGFDLGESPLLSRINKPEPPTQLYGSPKLTSKYNPTSYADGDSMSSPIRHNNPSANNFMDEDDDFSESTGSKVLDVKSVSEEISRGSDNKHAMTSLLELLKSSNNMGGFSGSQLQNQWDTHFDSVLYGVLGVLRTDDCDTKFSALTALKEMLRTLANRFRNHIEVTVTHILQIHKDNTKEIVKAAEEASTTLCSAVQPTKVIEILGPLAKTDEPEIAQACLKMMTCAMNRCSPGDLTVEQVDEIIPGILQCYDSEKSGVRKAAVFCLVALHRVIGNSELLRRLSHLSGGKMKLLQLYIKRSQGNGTTEC